MSIYPGDTAIVSIIYRVDGTLTDPDSVTITVTDPLGDAIETNDPATRDDTGMYHYDYTFADDAITGDYTFTWNITVGTTVSNHSQILTLDISPVSNYYADEATIRGTMKQHTSDFTNSQIVHNAIMAAERGVNGKLGIIESLTEADFVDDTTSLRTAKLDILTQAANLRAMAYIMDSLYTSKDKRSPSADSYEKQSDLVLAPFL